MGSAMAANLKKAGFRVVGYDVVGESRRRLKRAGGVPASDVAGVAREAAVIVTSLPSVQALLDVSSQIADTHVSIRVLKAAARGRRRQTGASPRRPPIVIETSTLPIAVKEQARETLAAAGIVMLDCPLSGTGAQARTKDIAVYASGVSAAYRHVIPILEGFARAHYYVGPFGSGSKMKFAANLLVAIHNVAAGEAMVLAMKSGLDAALAYKVLTDGGGSSRMFQVRGPMMVNNDYASDVTMKLSVWTKDMDAIAEFAKSVGVKTPLFSATAPIYAAATAANSAEDTGAVCAVLERMANYRR
jgi:3-hydroxyisobutyrate dehydrogenase-like beta-hydroxyacid dehydrogenase